MIDFSEKFRKTDGKPIQYMDKTLIMFDQFPLRNLKAKLNYRIISTNSEWRQGFAVSTKGIIKSSDGNIIKKGWADIWEDTAPREDSFYCESKDGFLDIKNIWDTGNGCIESWTNGAAMWIEEIPGGRRYHCNDGHFDDDFDDIIFEIIVVEPDE